MAHARAMGEIRKRLRAQGCMVPLVADVHHNGVKIAIEVAQHVDKVRINPDCLSLTSLTLIEGVFQGGI